MLCRGFVWANRYLLLDPVHHAAQLSADDFDRVLGFVAAGSRKERASGLVLKDEVAGEFTLLDIFENAFHFFFRFIRNDARSGNVVEVR